MVIERHFYEKRTLSYRQNTDKPHSSYIQFSTSISNAPDQNSMSIKSLC